MDGDGRERPLFCLGPGAIRQQTITIRAYAAAFTPTIQQIGYIPELAVHLQARTPVGDTWVPFGGLTAVVHPVNQDSRIVLDPIPGATVTFTGRLTSSGTLNPPLGGRDVHLRVQAQNGTITWVRTATNAAGNFQVILPTHLTTQTIRAQAYTAGGRGFAPAVSNEIVRPGSPTAAGVVPDGVTVGGVIATLAVDGRFSTLVGLLQRSGLATSLERREGGFTLFAPTDGAFKASGVTLDRLAADREATQRFLQTHVSSGIFTPWDLRNQSSVSRLSGQLLPVTTEQALIRIGNVQVVGEPINVPGGVVFAVDGDPQR